LRLRSRMNTQHLLVHILKRNFKISIMFKNDLVLRMLLNFDPIKRA
jgi:hypothetical protein